jgi:hypothetical protein
MRISSHRKTYVGRAEEDNLALTQRMRQTRNVCDEHGDFAATSLIENRIDEERNVAHGSSSTRPGELNPK